ncbi:hypothetical protein [Phenylobacterium conjunctum]|uniref:Uncharacterized protein n=1 Tax=Phenylobacterium conjunctum TaxID=1298959 RepID=A0ABW3T2M2_9CAUL
MTPLDLEDAIAQEHEIDRLMGLADLRAAGVSWSGLSAPPHPPRTDSQILAAAHAKILRRAAWAASPQGDFTSIVASLQRACDAALNLGERLRSATARGDTPSACGDLVHDISVQVASALRQARRLRRLSSAP